MQGAQGKKDKSETIYIIENAVSESARETALDKVRKLVMRDAEDFAKNQAL